MTDERRGISETIETLRSEVYQSNVFLQARKDFDLMGMRLFLIALSGINPHFSNNDKYYDEKFKIMFFPTSKLTELLGNSKYLGLIPKTCVKLALASVKLTNDNDSDSKLVNLFRKVEYRPREGLYICFNDKMRPHLLDLLYAKKGYTKLRFRYLIRLTSLYAVRLLELLLQYQNISHYKNIMEIERRFSIEELRFMLNVPEWAYRSRLDNFKKHVIDIPVKEINDHTPYVLRYKAIKKGKKTIAFKFMLGTHHVPLEIKGKAPEFSNDAINYLRALGFNNKSAQAIFYKCNNVEDCISRAYRAQAVLLAQKSTIQNRLGFLRKAIEEDWRLGSMIDKEDPYSKPGWSAILDYRHKSPKEKSARTPKNPADTPPNGMSANKMDKELADAIAQGKFYTPDNDGHVNADRRSISSQDSPTRNDEDNDGHVNTDRRSISSQDSPTRNDEDNDGHVNTDRRSISSQDSPTRNDEDNDGHVNADRRSISSQSSPTRNDEDNDGHVNADRRSISSQDSPTRNDEDNDGHVNADRRSISSQSSPTKNDQSYSSSKTSSEWTSLGDIVIENISDIILQRRIAKEREAEGKANEVPLNNPIEDNYYEKSAAKLAELQSRHYNSPEERQKAFDQDFEEEMAELAAKKARERELYEKNRLARQQAANESASTQLPSSKNKSPSPALQILQRLAQNFIQLDQSSRALEESLKRETEEDLKNREMAFQKEKLGNQDGNAQIISTVPPPLSPYYKKRKINLPLPPPPPPGFKKERRKKFDRLILKSIEELGQLYVKANELNEEPESILARTIGPDVKTFKYERNELTGQEYLSLNGKKISRTVVDDILARRETPELWRTAFEFPIDFFKITFVEMMRIYIKTFGALSPMLEPTEKQLAAYKKYERDIYTNKVLHPQSN